MHYYTSDYPKAHFKTVSVYKKNSERLIKLVKIFTSINLCSHRPPRFATASRAKYKNKAHKHFASFHHFKKLFHSYPPPEAPSNSQQGSSGAKRANIQQRVRLALRLRSARVGYVAFNSFSTTVAACDNPWWQHAPWATMVVKGLKRFWATPWRGSKTLNRRLSGPTNL